MDNSIDLVSSIALNNIGNSLTSNNAAAATGKTDSDTLIRSDFALLLDKAISENQVNQTAVEQAISSIQDDTFDTGLAYLQFAVKNIRLC